MEAGDESRITDDSGPGHRAVVVARPAPRTALMIIRAEMIKAACFRDGQSDAMVGLGPVELLGQPVMDENGVPLGIIKGVHQLHFPGGFEEVTIQNGKGMLFALIDELVPAGIGYILPNGHHRHD